MDAATTSRRCVVTLFQVGVTGHRAERLASADEDALERAARRVLQRVRDAACEASSGGACTLRLLSSLAEGSDRMVATVALSLGYELQCPLPLDAADFEQEAAHMVSSWSPR